MMAVDISEAIQQLILATLDQEGTIDDTTCLKLDGQLMDQQLVLGVLKRLAAHEVVTLSHSVGAHPFSVFLDGRI